VTFSYIVTIDVYFNDSIVAVSFNDADVTLETCRELRYYNYYLWIIIITNIIIGWGRRKTDSNLLELELLIIG
jgi:hypothetical protein